MNQTLILLQQMETVYIFTAVVCLVSYIFINWYDGMDLSLGDLVMFTIIALVPFVNVCFLVYIAVMVITQLDLTDIPAITIIKGKE